jgi:streptogramin lyase
MRQNRASRLLSPLVALAFAVALGACSGSPNLSPGGPQTADITEFQLTADLSQPSRPLSLAVGPDRNLWFVEFDAKSIGMLDLATQAVSHYPLSSSGSNPTHITMGPDGELWFTETGPADSDPADTGTNNIAEISSAGDITEFPLPGTDTDPAGIALGPDGHLWFTQAASGDVRRSTAGGSISDAFMTGAVTSMPAGIVTGPDADLWFAETSTALIGRLDPTGNLNEFPLPDVGSSPTEIAMGSDGNLWFTEGATGKIGRITPDGTIAEFTTPTGNSVPEGIALGPDCDIWFTEANANLIGRIDPSGHITEFLIPTPNSQPAGIALGPDGNIWFTESAANQLARLIPPAGSSTACSIVTLPPVAKCRKAKLDTDPGLCTAATASIDNGSLDPQSLAFTQTTSPDGPYNLGSTEATLTIRRSPTIAAACAAEIEVDDVEAPKITCPVAVSSECTSPGGAMVSLTATATDNCPGLNAVKCEGSGSTFPLGTTSVTCNAADASNNTSSCITSVTVKDSTPPVISAVTANPAMLWPPNHRGVPVTVSVAVNDTCDANVASSCTIVGVSASESCRSPAYRITEPLTVVLAAEREGDRARTYTIQVKCSDASGNSALGNVTVTVPHDQGNGDQHHGDKNGGRYYDQQSWHGWHT